VAQAKVHAKKLQPKRLKHYSAKEHAVRDASVQAMLKGELRACLCKQQTWYSSERSLLCALQRRLRERGHEMSIIAIYDTIMVISPKNISGAERREHQIRGSSRRFWWGGLSAGDIPHPRVDFMDLIPLQALVFDDSELIVELIHPDHRGETTSDQAAFLQRAFESHAQVLAGYGSTSWGLLSTPEKNAITSAIGTKQREFTRLKLCAMVAAGALDPIPGEGLREPVRTIEVFTTEDEEEAEKAELAAQTQEGEEEEQTQRPQETARDSDQRGDSDDSGAHLLNRCTPTCP
jgi:hypothetical protein